MNGITLKTLDGKERQFGDLASANKWARAQLDSLPEKLKAVDDQRRRIAEFKVYLEQQLGMVRRRGNRGVHATSAEGRPEDGCGV
jgi:hypothetical protein